MIMNLPQRLQDADDYWKRTCVLYARDVISNGNVLHEIPIGTFFNIISRKRYKQIRRAYGRKFKKVQMTELPF